MFYLPGFLGTKALLYMDVVTIYFALLPFLLAYSIYLAIQKKYQQHFAWQGSILGLTIAMVLIFEIGVRLTGGFIEYAQHSSVSYEFLVTFLIIHIIIATASVAGWLYVFISAYKAYKNGGVQQISSSKHKRIGKAIFLSLTLNSILGICIYIFLFIM